MRFPLLLLSNIDQVSIQQKPTAICYEQLTLRLGL